MLLCINITSLQETNGKCIKVVNVSGIQSRVMLTGTVRCSLTPNFVSDSLYVCSVNFIHFWVSFIPYLLFIQFFLLRGTRIIFTLTSTLWCLITFAFNYSRYTQVLVAYAVIGNDCQKQKGEKIVRGIRFFMRLFSTDMTRSDQIGSS